MTATWHALVDWTDVFVDATDYNEQLRDNMEWLRTRPFNNNTLGTVTTTSASFVALTGSSTALTSAGGNMIVVANGKIGNNTAGAVMMIDLAIDTVRQGHATNGLVAITVPANNYLDCINVAFMTSSPPSAGSHDYAIYWKTSTGTGTSLLRLYTMEIR